MKIALIILSALFIFFIAPTMIMSAVIYTVVLVRTKPEKWSRECSMPEDAELSLIYKDAEQWYNDNKEVKTDVTVISEGLKLCGEYYDFGGKSAVIIIPGRMEGCRYSCHFAEPYKKAGFNVLVIDNRSHGLSEGRYNSLGFCEYRDVIEWSRLLHERFGNEKVLLHGICIGSSTALFALTAKECPDYLSGMTADGMYVTFFESFKNHMILQGRPLFPFLYEVMFYIRVFSRARVMSDGPVKKIKLLSKPILFLHSREDEFSLPEKAEKLYADCNSEKRIVWFSHGAHSRIRINNREEYDNAVIGFCETFNNEKGE